MDCGVLSGIPFIVDRDMITKELGLNGLSWDSMVGVSDCDFMSETLQWRRNIHAAQFSLVEDLIIYSTVEFGLVRLSDDYSTVCSLMPQTLAVLSYYEKRVADLWSHGTQKVLPSTYNKDLQESIESILDHAKPVTGGRFKEGIAKAFVSKTIMERRSAEGGTGQSSGLGQIQVIKAALSGKQIQGHGISIFPHPHPAINAAMEAPARPADRVYKRHGTTSMRHRGHGKGFCKALVALRTNDVLATRPRPFHVAMEAYTKDLLV
ncbi:hypothetical protein MKX08_000944 [Trichoderma sp. CBMAI-0020]|nr:hypothetical protein MKX08_000944 [Trichoderma sp. CBMAI-0020]